MGEYLQIEKEKIKWGVLFFWGVLLLLGIGIVLFGNNKGELTLVQRVFGPVVFATGFTVVFIPFCLLLGFYDFYKRKRPFSRKNWAGFFLKNGFQKKFVNQERMLERTAEVREGSIAGFNVIARALIGSWKDYLVFEFYVERRQIPKEDFKLLEKLLREKDAYFDWGFICKHIQVKNQYTSAEIENQLNEIASFLIEKGLKPMATQA